MRGSWHEAQEPSLISVNELSKRQPNLPTELLRYCRLSRNVRGFPTALSAWLFVFQGCIWKKGVGGGGGAAKKRILVEEIRLKSGCCNPKGQTAMLHSIRLWAFLMPFTSKEEAQAVIVGVDLCFEGCSSV